MDETGIGFNIEDCRTLLGRTPAVLSSLLLGLPERWLYATEGPGTWSPYDVLGHLIHGEKTDWIPRARQILMLGEEAVFAPFDREAMFAASGAKSCQELLSEFSRLRAVNLQALEEMQIKADMLELRGRHPEFGPVTLRQLLATWAAHDLGHLVQINRVLAWQYRQEVGPWAAYLSVMGSHAPRG